jgi:VWFA-related protein
LRRAALVSAVAVTAAGAAPRARQAEEPPAPSFGTTAVAVLVDVVVRDSRGHVVRDLRAEEFRVYEGGELQPLLSFEVVSRGGLPSMVEGRPDEGLAPAGARRPQPAFEPGPPPAVVALVFDRLTPGARALAKRAAHAYVEAAAEGERVGVFSVGLSLGVEQPFSDDREALRAAIDRAVDGSTAVHESARDRIRQLADRADAIAAQTEAPGSQGTGPTAGAVAASLGATSGQAGAEAALVATELRMLRTLENLERDQQGYASMNGLLAVVNALRLHPGRKTAVLFSEGLSIPPNVHPKFRALVDAANRGNVAVYALDAAGLRAESATAETAEELRMAAQEQIRQRSTGRDEFGGALLKELERNEDRLRLDPHSGLGELARETGGFLVRDTNDLAAAARRIEEETRFHYLLSYAPRDTTYDGSFRRIEVEVLRPNVRVQARSGYFAVPASDPFPIQPFEAPALALLAQDPPPTAVPVRAQGLSLPQPERPGLVSVLVEVPGAGLAFEVDEKGGEYRADFVIVGRLLDGSGQPVERVSHHYTLTGPAADLDRARRGDMIFYRELELEPGSYTLEAIVQDRLGESAGVTTSALEVASGRIRMSSLVVVKRLEGMDAASGPHPLRFGETLLYPNLGEAVHKSAQPKLALFLTALLHGGAVPGATLEVFQGGESRGRAPLELPAPSAGRLEHVAVIPIEGFPAGDYELWVTLSAGGAGASRGAKVSIRE